MTRFVIALAFCGALGGSVAWAADEDPIGAKLATAKAEYEKSITKARGDLITELKKKAEVAQKAGNLAALEKVEDEIKAFEDKQTLPKLVSTRDYNEAVRVAAIRLKSAYEVAMKDYTVAGKTEYAKAARAALEDLKKETGGDTAKDNVPDDGLPVGTKLVGTGLQTWGPPNKPESKGSEIEWTVIKRSGKQIRIANHNGYESEGTFVKGKLDMRVVKAPAGDTTTVGSGVFSGNFNRDKGTLYGWGKKKTDPTYANEVKITVVKD